MVLSLESSLYSQRTFDKAHVKIHKENIWKSTFWIPVTGWIFAESFPLFESISLPTTHASLSQFTYAILFKFPLFLVKHLLPKRWAIEPPCMFQEVKKNNTQSYNASLK